MRNYLFILFSGICLAFILYSCGNTRHESLKKIPSPEEAKESIIEANKVSVKKESDIIDLYVKAHYPDMQNSGTGLRYKIYYNGRGEQAKTGQIAKVKYKISLLDGTVCYSSDEMGPKEFMIGQDHVESGLHEGILFLHVGDKALFILPSHLGHGLLGDEDRIPPKASLIFDIELLSLK